MQDILKITVFDEPELSARSYPVDSDGMITFWLLGRVSAVGLCRSPEPFGLVIVEAMATARAVVMSLAGGVAEIVTPGVDALGHVPGDVHGLAARITELAASPELRARLGRAARLTAARSFDRGRLARDLVPIYQAVLREC